MRSPFVRLLPIVSMLLLALGLAACDDETGPEGPFTLTFTADGSFNGPHGGQAFEAALVAVGGAAVETTMGTVSADADPAFSFSFVDALEDGQAYEVHLWIDSNFGGGSAGVCDPPSTDHQWVIGVGTVAGDTSIDYDHDPASTSEVCATFD